MNSSSIKLKLETARRQLAEKTLRHSQNHSRQLLEQSRRQQKELRLLSHRLLSVQEEERKRISRELHDVIAQFLTSINLRLAALKTAARANTQGLTQNIERTQQLVEKSVDIVHRFAFDLRPAVLDDLGLVPALHSFAKSFTQQTGIRVSLTTVAGIDQLDNASRTVLYRVAQEALTNVSRHAQASRVDVSIQRRPKTVHLQIKDNGKSFDVKRIFHAGKSKRLGLLGMRERVEMVGGQFTVESSHGQGTTIQVQIPFKNSNPVKCLSKRSARLQ